MTNQIRVVAEFSIADGKSDSFKKLLTTAVETVEANEPDTLSYEFYFNNDESACYALELYKHAEAVLAHIKNVGEILTKLLDVSQITRLELFGNVTAELEQVTAPFEPKIFKHWDGFTR